MSGLKLGILGTGVVEEDEEKPARQQRKRKMPTTVFRWVNPTKGAPLETFASYEAAINAYFEECEENETQPRLTGLALALGLAGPTSLYRLARRRPDLRYIISRATTAVAHGYESQINGGAAPGALFMLKHLPDFDMEEPAGSAPIQHFRDRHEIMVESIPGVESPHEKGSDMSPAEAYMKVVQGGEIMEINERPNKEKAPEDAEDFEFRTALRELHEEKLAGGVIMTPLQVRVDDAV